MRTERCCLPCKKQAWPAVIQATTRLAAPPAGQTRAAWCTPASASAALRRGRCTTTPPPLPKPSLRLGPRASRAAQSAATCCLPACALPWAPASPSTWPASSARRRARARRNDRCRLRRAASVVGPPRALLLGCAMYPLCDYCDPRIVVKASCACWLMQADWTGLMPESPLAPDTPGAHRIRGGRSRTCCASNLQFMPPVHCSLRVLCKSRRQQDAAGGGHRYVQHSWPW